MFKEVLTKVKEERALLEELIQHSSKAKEVGVINDKLLKLDKVERVIREYLSMK